MRRKIAAGNWKMNGTAAALSEVTAMGENLPPAPPTVVICPPAPLLSQACVVSMPFGIQIGGQDCHAEASGAFTGDTSAAMVADSGATYVIVGHSERRDAYRETDADVAAKAQAAWTAGLTAIVCVGEDLEQRTSGKTLDVIKAQLSGSVPDGASDDTLVVAYEPVWAIGTGKVPELAQIEEVHDFIRAELTSRFGAETSDRISLLYGGSVKAENAATIFQAANVDGALVGGASLKAADFSPIIAALAAS
ncbi:Triosephosphate isomerase [Sulfitobacter noctilucicola]|uniref:Triosephosphate isomerase n=1 Tax=Sulfitobacter noctilucicola TaxID=1342301 RepID=A0A7W6MCI0_9RHOB|nr:triose-phosphate isomerase [Sulfitobacter noctilucicola]KIN66378.1 Triosephosphate isomerase [Sulfitobacter noctilucicola]MBB4175727.1 triosephosphate isomerase [Sulfitobacter noctilucicola]